MYTLLGSPGAASMAAHWLLIEIGAKYQYQRVDLAKGEHKLPSFLQLNPNGVVPVLYIEGEPVYESAALVMLLAERHPEARLAPAVGTRERSLYLQWCVHFANTLQPAYRGWFYPEEWAGPLGAERVKAEARVRIEAAWDRLEAHLLAHGPWIAGAQLSAVDFQVAMLARWSRHMPKPATAWPTLARLLAQMKARPSFQTLQAVEGWSDA